MSNNTSMLFARPSFVEGMSRIFDFAGSISMYNYSRTPSEADYKAIKSDWKAVGEDIWMAIRKYVETR